MKKKLLDFVKKLLSDRRRAAIVFAVLAVLLFLAFRTIGKKEEAAQIQTATVERGTIVSSITASGNIISSNIENITTQASGTVSKVYVSVGNIDAVLGRPRKVQIIVPITIHVIHIM